MWSDKDLPLFGSGRNWPVSCRGHMKVCELRGAGVFPWRKSLLALDSPGGYRSVTGSSPCKFVQRDNEDRSMMSSLPCLQGGMGSGKLLFNPLISNTFVPDYSWQENTTKKKKWFIFILVWFVLYYFFSLFCVSLHGSSKSTNLHGRGWSTEEGRSKTRLPLWVKRNIPVYIYLS